MAIAVSLLAGCASVDTSTAALNKRIAAAQADAATEADADDYSQFLIARYASLINDPDEAAKKYAQVARSRPDDVSIAERAVFSALLANDFPLALSISSRTSSYVREETSLPRISLAADALARGETLKVPDILEGADPGLFNAMIMTAIESWALFSDGKPSEAKLKLLDASSDDPYLDGIVMNLLGLMEVANGDDAAAMDTFSRINLNGTLIASSAESYGRLLVRAGRSEEALAVLTDFREAAGHNPAITDLIRKITAGEPVAVERLTARQGAALSVYVPAAALAVQAQNDLPGVYYSIALRLDPKLHAARALWADALDIAGRHEEAIAMLNSIPESSPFYISARGQLAWALHRDGQDARALDFAHATLAHQPDRDLRIQMADLLRSLERDGEAIGVLDEIIDADEAAHEPDWRLYYARGATLERLGRWPEAEQDLRTAKALNPTSPEVLNYLGYSWIDRGIYLEEGLDLIRKALTLRPDSGAITDSLGWAHYRIGEYETAIGYLERAAELEPGLAEVNDHLGDAYWMAGRKVEARFQWRRAITLSEDHSEIARIERKLVAGPSLAMRSQLP